MNVKHFSKALNEINSKYIVEAIDYKSIPRKHNRIKWTLAAAACFAFLIITSIRLLPNKDSNLVTTSGTGDAAPMIYVMDTLYKQSSNQTCYDKMNSDFLYLGKVKSNITSSQTPNDGIPKENFQANLPIVGSNIYQYKSAIVIQIDNKYWLYNVENDASTTKEP